MGREAFIRASIILAACSLDGAKSQRTVACPNSVGEVGYVDITSLNEDMHDEFENITVGGKAPSPPYDYILCPGTVFDGNEILRPVLNQAQFFCGDRGISRTCTISGGTQQVIIADSTDPTYQIDVINFFGVAFSDFTESSISAFAGKGTSTSFNECTWKNWNLQSTAAIDAVYSPDPAAAGMTILLTNCSIASATGGVAIRNAYSEVIINRLDVSNSTIITLLETMNSGFSRVDNLVVTSSSMTAVTLTTSKGQLDIRSSMIFDNVEISDMLISQDNGTLMIIDSLEILNNTRNPEAWNGVFVNSSSTAMITNSHFEGNSNMESAVTSSVFGETTITDTKISSNIGTFPSVSALAFAISDAFITLKRVSLLDNSNYTSAIFAIFRSDATFTETCIVGGNSSSVIFIGEGCSYSLDASTNYIFDQNSSACNSFGTRLFKEDGNSNCFVGSSTGGPSNCTGTCREAATATLCINDGTAAPVATSTSLSPSKSPSTMGITIAPVTPLTPAPVTPLTPAPVTPLTPAPVTPLTPAPVTPLTPAPVTPLTPVPVTPLTPAPLTPLTPAPVTPLTPAPVTVTTPSPLVAPSIYPLAAPTLPSPTAYSLVAKLKSPTTPGSKEGTIKKGASKKRKSKKGKSKKGKSKKRKNKKGKNEKKFKKDGKGGKGKGGKGETQNISGARDINTGITNGHGNVKEDGVSALPSYFKRIHGSRLPTA